MPKNCGCGGRATTLASLWKWVSADGQQTVTGLTEIRAKTRANQYGGTALPM